MGPSGSGKSTVLSLIEGFYTLPKLGDPQRGSGVAGGAGGTATGNRGQVLVGGRDVSAMDAAALRRMRLQLGLVSQEPSLFAATIGDNIRYGRPDASDAEVHAAAEARARFLFASLLQSRCCASAVRIAVAVALLR